MAKQTPGGIYVWDETLRDGEQSPGVAFSVQDKVEIARVLDQCGVAVIDAGFPAVSASEREAIAAIVSLGLKARVGATVRARQEDIDLALDCGVREVYMFLPTSPLLMRVKFGACQEEIHQRAIDMAEYAIRRGLRIVFIAEDTSRSDPMFVSDLFSDLYRAGTAACILTDTVGNGTPVSIGRLVSTVRENTPPGLDLGVHCHNDYGLASANTLAAVEAGVQFVTTTVNGIGERAGNAAMEEVVAALEHLHQVSTGIDLTRLFVLSSLVEERAGMPVAPNKAVVGWNAFRHESGIHTEAMITATESYEVLRPEAVGRSREWIFGKHSGRALIKQLLAERQIELPAEDLEAIKSNLEALADPGRKHQFILSLRSYYADHLAISTERLLDSVRGNRVKEEC